MVVKNFKFMKNYNFWKMYLQVKILTLDIFTHLLPPPPPHSPYRPCGHDSLPDSITTPQETMTWNIRLFIFYMICNFFSNVMTLQFCK